MQREYRDFNRLDPRLFKAFLAAADCKNFTLAAKKAALTQSGVSQQVAKLEDQVGTQLFQRVNKSVSLTTAGDRLVKYIDHFLDGMDLFFEEVEESEKGLQGRVSYAMPNSCLLSPHLGLMLEKRKSSPGIELDIHINANESVYEKVLDGKVDFGFVTEEIPNPALKFQPFCKEEFALLGSPDLMTQNIDLEFLKTSSFVDFPGMNVYFSRWLEFYFPKEKSLAHSFLDIKSSISQLDGVLTLLKGRVGLSFLPKHCAMDDLKKGKLVEFKPKNAKRECMNQIYIVSLKGAGTSRRCQKVMDWFWEMKG